MTQKVRYSASEQAGPVITVRSSAKSVVEMGAEYEREPRAAGKDNLEQVAGRPLDTLAAGSDR